MTRHLGLCVLFALFGCASTAASDPPPVATTTAVVTRGVDAAGPRDVATHELPRPAPAYSDDQIVALLATFNAGEVDLATVAHDRGKDPRVRAFAATLRDDHRAALQAELALGQRLVAHAPTERMREMQRAAADEAAKLKALEGHELDVEFLANQVSTQRDALAMLDVELIPSARRADVRSHLADYRSHVDHHLRDATTLSHEIGGPIIARR